MHGMYMPYRFELITTSSIYLLLYLVSRFNSGKFGVPWEETEAVLQDLRVSMVVYEPPSDLVNKK